MNDQKLPVIIPYFNHTNARVNRRLLEESINRFSQAGNCRVILAEGIWNMDAALPDFSDRVFRHLKYSYTQALWIKENLINLALRDCGIEWDCAVWVDKDVEFLDPDWASKAREALANHDIIQPWSRAVCTGETGAGSTISDYLNLYQGRLLHDDEGMMSWASNPGGKGGHEGHCGFAWGATREFMERIGGLYDRCLLGGGDDYLKASLRPKDPENEVFLRSDGHCDDRRMEIGVARFYGDFKDLFSYRCRGARIGSVSGKIIHHYHGKLSSRGYLSRYDVAARHGFDGSGDVSCASDGTIRLLNEDLVHAIGEYFSSREEHLVA